MNFISCCNPNNKVRITANFYFHKSQDKQKLQLLTGNGTPKGLGVHWVYMFMGRGTYTGTGIGTIIT